MCQTYSNSTESQKIGSSSILMVDHTVTSQLGLGEHLRLLCYKIITVYKTLVWTIWDK